MLLKLFFGAQAPSHILIRNVESMVETHRAVLEMLERTEHDSIDKNPQYPDAPYWKMAARFGQIEMKAHLQWAEETLRELRRLAKAQPAPARARTRRPHVKH